MDKQLLILGCSQTKRESPGLLPAIHRYEGPAYKVLLSYLRECHWPRNLSVAILSAKYGLVGGFTGIEDYDERMTRERATAWAPHCQRTLVNWATEHSSIHLALGKDYLPALQPGIGNSDWGKVEVFEGGIGTKLGQIKQFLHQSESHERVRPHLAEPGTGSVTYFLPDWDDLLDADFNFQTDQFSGTARENRDDKHCCVLMQPKRMCDGVLVSLAQHITSKGPLRRMLGTDSGSLAPPQLRSQFGLGQDQFLFGDCGAFSYVNEEQPAISVEQAVSLYDLHGFDFGASVDHIPVGQVEGADGKVNLTEDQRRARVDLTRRNAERFLTLSKQRHVSFTPVGTIQALDAVGYAESVRYYHGIGYRHLAIGGLVPLKDAVIEEIVVKVMAVSRELQPRPWIHLFGVFRPKLQAQFRALGVDSFDSATYFRKAWLRSDQNYLSADGKWYAALRVPMTSDARTRKKMEESGASIEFLQQQEARVMVLLEQYEREEVDIETTLDALLDYDQYLTRSSDLRSLREKYRTTLQDRPWLKCDCPFCGEVGIHMLIFRGANRNKRRGAHNTLMLYGSLGDR